LTKAEAPPTETPNLEVAVEAPDRRTLDDLGVASARRLDEIGAHPVVGAKLIALVNRRRGDSAKDLAAGAGILVEQQVDRPASAAVAAAASPAGPAPITTTS